MLFLVADVLFFAWDDGASIIDHEFREGSGFQNHCYCIKVGYPSKLYIPECVWQQSMNIWLWTFVVPNELNSSYIAYNKTNCRHNCQEYIESLE